MGGGGSAHSKDKGLNLRHRDLLIPLLVEDFPSHLKKQIEENIVGWMDLPLDVILVAIHVFEELKTTVLILQIFNKTRNAALGTIQSSPIVTQSKNHLH